MIIRMLNFDDKTLSFRRAGTPEALTLEEKEEMRRYSWCQCIPFENGTRSPGLIPIADRIEKYQLAELDFKGKSVLGIGCFEGFALYYAEARGASRVVGLTTDGEYRPHVGPARQFAKRVLRSKVEFSEIPLTELSPATIGTFDIVLYFDMVPHSDSPAFIFERIASVVTGDLICCTPFAITNGATPWCVKLPHYERRNEVRNRVAPNLPWILKTISENLFDFVNHKVWDFDYASIHARKRSLPNQVDPVPLASLPMDEGVEQTTAILIMSCKRYEQVWDPFFTLLRRYWPDCPYKVYLGTNAGSHPEAISIYSGEDGTAKTWGTALRRILAQMKETHVLFFQEDFLLTAPTDNATVRRAVRHVKDLDIGCLRLMPAPPPTGSWTACHEMGTLAAFDDFRVSAQLAIWKRQLFYDLLRDGEDPWTTEFAGSRRSQFCTEPFLSMWTTPVPYYVTGVTQGRWEPGALELLKREGISTAQLTERI